MCAAIPTAHSSQLDLQKRRVRIKEGASSHRYTLSHTQSPDNTMTTLHYVLHSLLQLSMDQKCNIATRELDELRERMQRDQEEAQMNFDNLRVSQSSI